MSRQDAPPIDHVKEGVIFALWRSGFDTKDIAHKCGVTESQVYNLLLRVKEGGQ